MIVPAGCRTGGRLVDLSLVIGDGVPGPPSVTRAVQLTTRYRGPAHWQTSELSFLLHTGSHVDFPRHCDANGDTAADVGLERSCGEAVVLDLGELPAEHEISVADVAPFEGLVVPGRIALVRTAWTDHMWGRFPEFYVNSPTCSAEAIGWLIARGAKAIGFDCFPERAAHQQDFSSEDFVVHKTIFDGGALLLQLITGLDQLPRGVPVEFYAAFVRIDGAEGAPARFFVRLHDELA